MIRPRAHGIQVWEDEGGSSTPPAWIRDPAVPGVPKPRRFAALGRPRRRHRLVTRLALGDAPARPVPFKRKRSLVMVFFMYAIVVLTALTAVAVAAIRDSALARRPAPVAVRK